MKGKMVLNKTEISRFAQYVETCDDIVIISHKKADGDALGSSGALFDYLSSKGKTVRVLLPNPVSKTLSFIQNKACRAACFNYEESPAEVDVFIENAGLIICMDFNVLKRIETLESDTLKGMGLSVQKSKAPKVLIDHHLHPDRETFDLVISQTEISSASELLFWVLYDIEEGKKLPGRCSYCLMCGMTTDTNNFDNSVFPSTLDMASKLLSWGVDRDYIVAKVNNCYRETRLRAMGYILDNMEITPEGMAIITLNSKEIKKFNIEEGETEGFVNLPLALKKVRMSIFIKQAPDRLRVSIRSKKGTSANRAATLYFHGGGHELASGGSLIEGRDVESMAQVREYCRKVSSEFLAKKDK